MTSDRHRHLTVEGIVLRRRPVGEHDQIYTLYTLQKGRIRSSARGALRPKNPWRGILEPFHRIRADVYMSPGSSLYRFNQAEVLSRPSAFLNHLSALNAAYLVLEALDRFTPDESPHEELYDAVLQSLGAITRAPDRAREVVLAFCLRFFRLSGFAVELQRCVQCGRERPGGKSAYCVPSMGGVVCRACLTPDRREQDRVLTGEILDAAEAAASGIPEAAERLDGAARDDGIAALQRIVREMFAYHLGELPKSLALMG
ncbi:MAG TPA: DNA repair protein RecO [bacterium]|nr:DNA repair protein RecO [bacterium]